MAKAEVRQGRSTPSARAAHVLALQRSAGNRAATQLITAQRTPPTATATRDSAGVLLERRVQAVANESARRRTQLVRDTNRAIDQVDAMLGDLNGVGDVYRQAYATYQEVLAAGNAHAQAMDQLASVVIGLAIGTGVGLGLGAAFPLAQNAGLAMNALAEIRNGVASTILGAAESWAGDQVNAVRGGSDQAPAGGQERFERAHPAMQQVRAYEQATDLYRRLARLNNRTSEIANLESLVGPVRADCRELAVSGRHSSLSQEQIEQRVAGLERVLAAQARMLASVQELLTAVADARAAASLAREDANPREIEKTIWIRWMASLTPNQAEILDADPVEERLGLLGIMAKRGMHNAPQEAWQSSIGWGVGVWQSDDDSRNGARLAQRAAEAMDLVGQTGTFRRGSGSTGGVFLDSRGRSWAARLGSGTEASSADGQQVVVTAASPALVDVALPEAVRQQQRSTFAARRLRGQQVVVFNVRREVGSSGQFLYRATARSDAFPGQTWPARQSGFAQQEPAENSSVTVAHTEGDTLVWRSDR